MKTYLTRLISRAQSATAPVAVQSRPTLAADENPFENTAPLVPPLTPIVAPTTPAATRSSAPLAAPSATRETTLTSAPNPSPVLVPPSPSPAVTRQIAPIAEEKLSAPVEQRVPVRRKQSRPTAPLPSSESSEISLTPPTGRALAPTHTRPVAEAVAKASEVEPSAKLIPPAPPTIAPTSSPTPTAADDRAQLQRQADQFMAHLSRRAESLLASSPATETTLQPNVRNPAPTPTVARLEPTAGAPQPPPPPPAPSVVIGRLSVEVVPPNATPHPARNQGRASARTTVSRPLPTARSSARFGLSQL
jgi:hypothetical protein